LKNRVHNSYSIEVARRPDQVVIAASEREALRVNILPLLASTPSKAIATQLANALKSIVAFDFPAKWPSLTGEIKRLLLSSDIKEVHAGCVATLEAVRAFRYAILLFGNTVRLNLCLPPQDSVTRAISCQI
jgi:hypothetical protein